MPTLLLLAGSGVFLPADVQAGLLLLCMFWANPGLLLQAVQRSAGSAPPAAPPCLLCSDVLCCLTATLTAVGSLLAMSLLQVLPS